ncbi:MAG: 1-acyl-sn-glycerol-3-phosphate acyltransferase [Ferruginibacter sp.]
MFYESVKISARIAFKFYCRHFLLNKKELLKIDGPLLLAVNHPNSFLDAIILCTLFDKPVYSLARGDVFKNRFIAKIIFSLKMLPVYRVSEGVENLDENYKTFDQCKEIFKQNGIVLIFSEGKCVNEWHLRPLKKGTARLAISSWEDGIPLKVLPVAVNYHSFRKVGKNVHLFFGEFITKNDLDGEQGYGRSLQHFNGLLQKQLEPLVYEIDASDKKKWFQLFFIPQPALKKILLFLPSLAGWLMHAPFYLPVKSFVQKYSDTGHYDSLIVAILFLGYPVYLLMITLAVFFITAQWYSFLLLILLPFTAWAYLQLKRQMD